MYICLHLQYEPITPTLQHTYSLSEVFGSVNGTGAKRLAAYAKAAAAGPEIDRTEYDETRRWRDRYRTYTTSTVGAHELSGAAIFGDARVIAKQADALAGAGVPRRWWWFAPRSSMAGQEVYQEGWARRRAQWQWAACRILAGARRQEGGTRQRKKQREAEAKAKAEAARCMQKQRWQQWGAARVSVSEQDSGQQVAAQKASEQQPIQRRGVECCILERLYSCRKL